MIRRLTVLLLLALLGLTRVALADDEEDALKKARDRWEQMTPEQRRSVLEAWERWKQLPADERRRREAIFEEHLKGSTPAEREELARKLRQVKQRLDLEHLRERQKRLRHIAEEFEKELTPELRERLAGMAEDRRAEILALGVARISEALREQFFDSLTLEERQGLEEVEGPRRGHALMELRVQKAVARLPAEARREIDGLPEAERRERLAAILRQVHEEDLRNVRARVGAEMGALADLPTEDIEARLRAPDLPRTLGELGLPEEPVLIRRLSHMPRVRIRQAIQKLRTIAAMPDAEARAKALRDFTASLPER